MTIQDVGETVRRAADGDARAWEALVDEFSPLMWWVTRAHRLNDAQGADVVQETWLRFLKACRTMHSPERAGAWLTTTARRECLAVLRQGKRERPCAEDDWTPGESAVPSAEAEVLRGESGALVRAAFRRLPHRQQVLLGTLADNPDASYAEVAAALAMPIGSIGPTRARALARLRALLEEQPAPALTS